MIPKIIHYCWLSGDPYTELVQRCIDSWKRHLPDYEIRLWDIEVSPQVPWVTEAYANRKYAFAADYIRFYALYHHGGIYLDSDVEVLKPFDGFLHHQSFIGYDTVGDFEAAIIGAQKGTPWVKSCLDRYSGMRFVLADGRLNTNATVPLLIRDVLDRQYGLHASRKAEDLKDHLSIYLSIYPSVFFSPKNLFTGKSKITEDTVTIHHFDGKWVERTWLFRMKFFLQKMTILVFGSRVHRRVIELLGKR